MLLFVSCAGSGSASKSSDVGGSRSGNVALPMVTAGSRHSGWLDNAGKVLTWGDYASGQLGDGSTTRRVLPVAIHGLASANRAQAITSGENHMLLVASDGRVFAWGHDKSGQLGDGGQTDSSVPVAVTGMASGVSAISVGVNHSCAVKEGGAWCWGFNGDGELGDGSTSESHVPVAVAGLMAGSVSAIATGDRHTCALSDQDVWCWGAGGELGNGGMAARSVPVAVTGLIRGVTAISAGLSHTCALNTGVVSCWGYNTDGELGNSNATNGFAPATVAGLWSNASAISAGSRHTCALKDGHVWCWGGNAFSQIGNGGTTDAPVPVEVQWPGAATASAGLPSSGTGPASDNSSWRWLAMSAFAIGVLSLGVGARRHWRRVH